jgi:DNA-binding response OmpR family regulator
MLAVHRRATAAPSPQPQPSASVARVRDVVLDFGRYEVTVAGRPVSLTRKELAVLEVLAERPGLVVRREQLLSQVWHSAYDRDGHTLDVHVAAIRAKTGTPELIETVRGVGYRLGPLTT